MAPEPMNEPRTAAFPVRKLVPLLRALADPEGKGSTSGPQAETIRRVEANVARSGCPVAGERDAAASDTPDD